jgi:hypothetical protein
MLFLHDSVLNAYGLCPFLHFDVDTEGKEEVTSNIRNQRNQWLKSQSDGGKLYFDLYEKVVVQSELHETQEAYKQQEKEIYAFAQKYLSDSQWEMLGNCKKFIQEYTDCHIKTKRLKERYKTFVHSLSVLYSETFFAFHEFYGAKYKTYLMVNEFVTSENMPKNEVQSTNPDMITSINTKKYFACDCSLCDWWSL